jgi:DNA-binding response OmpR family regulator
VRRALERALRLENHEVAFAADGEEALDALATEPADAVILDVMMPKLDGLEVCRRLRKAGDRTPVLMLTARDAIDDRVEGLDVGADDYLRGCAPCCAAPTAHHPARCCATAISCSTRSRTRSTAAIA